MKLQVIGDPVLHSKSPAIHGAMLARLGLDGIPYTAQVVRRGELPQYLAWARENGVTGFNATMPHKEDLIPLLDEIDPAAKALGAVNTVCLRDGKWVGFNTDGGGAVAALEHGLCPVSTVTVTLLGAGGAAKAVALALVRSGARQVFVCNRTAARAGELCALDPLGRLIPTPFSQDGLGRAAARSGLLVNCTNLGMEGCPGQFADFSFLDALPDGAAVFDLIYHPAETELLSRARRRGLSAMNGLPMLVWQAVLALEHFLDRPLDRADMAQAALLFLERKSRQKEL